MTVLIERKSELAAIRNLMRRGGLMIVDGGAGLGKTALLDAACDMASGKRRVVLRARGSDLERDFALGVVRQLFERHCADAPEDDRSALFAGPAHVVRPLLDPSVSYHARQDTSFTVLHGLYWLTVNIAARQPIMIAIDDAHWADDASLRWLAYLAPRVQEPEIALVVALRPDDRRSHMRELAAVRAAASASIGLALLSEPGVAAIARRALAKDVVDAQSAAIHRATGGNPFYVLELLRALMRADQPTGTPTIDSLMSQGGVDGVALQLGARLQRFDSSALRLAQAIAMLGDDCELRHAAAIADIEMAEATHLATALVRDEILGTDHPPRFIHPIVRHAVAQTLSSAQQDEHHRAAARILHGEHVAAGRVAAHLTGLRPAGDAWVVSRLREAAQAAMAIGAPSAAAELLERALAEPPPANVRLELLREAALAEQQAGRAVACQRLEEALAICDDQALRAELVSQLARAHAALFRWIDAVRVLDQALVALRDAPDEIVARLESQLIAAGLQ
ncbi:MAG: AAA family ATPase, partial [Alphaproteobacteria bacterium]|nr:AAA family ATPase [Alphaproteobacteria bacterium]